MIKRVTIAGESPYVGHLQTLCQQHGYDVELYHVDELDDQDTLDRLVNDVTECDLFLESLNESAASKQWLIEGVEANLRPQVPVLTNALAASPTEVASWCLAPNRVIGYGVLPPFQGIQTLEFVPALQADMKVAVQAREFWQKLGFGAVRVADTPGLVRGRLACMLINEAIFLLDQKMASAEDIDTAMQLAHGLPQGPLAWADEIGLDVVLGTLIAMYDFWGEERYRPAPLLKQKVRARHLGKKVGRGFFIDPLLAPPDI